jgi:hypothetical protein
MDLPADTSLPFFSYGLFRPGQIGFRDIEPFVARHEEHCEISGTLRERDGLPVLHDEDGSVQGAVLWFQQGKEIEAYGVIAGVESAKLYKWEHRVAKKLTRTHKVNVLLSVKPKRGSHETDTCLWDGSTEPLFHDALVVVEETLRQSSTTGRHPDDTKPLFRLQMAYMLLWSAIERFTSFKYGISLGPEERNKRFAGNPTLAKALKSFVKEGREVYRSDDPEQKKCLNQDNPLAAIKYYYQVRCNAVHRGKASYYDYDILLKSTNELLAVFRAVLAAEFGKD